MKYWVALKALDKSLDISYTNSCLKKEYREKAENEISIPPAKLREPGKVWAGANEGVEWTRELQTERNFSE